MSLHNSFAMSRPRNRVNIVLVLFLAFLALLSMSLLLNLMFYANICELRESTTKETLKVIHQAVSIPSLLDKPRESFKESKDLLHGKIRQDDDDGEESFALELPSFGIFYDSKETSETATMEPLRFETSTVAVFLNMTEKLMASHDKVRLFMKRLKSTFNRGQARKLALYTMFRSVEDCSDFLPLISTDQDDYICSDHSLLSAEYEFFNFVVLHSEQSISDELLKYTPNMQVLIHDLEFKAEGVPQNIITIPFTIETFDYVPYLQNVPANSLLNWHKPRIQLHLITMDRLKSFQRLIKSLNNALYFPLDSLDVFIHIDANADEETLKYVRDLEWNYGRITIHHRVLKGGLLAQVVESWFPQNNDEYAIMLEDDVEVSPLFYIYAKLTLLSYKYSADYYDLDQVNLLGISLYTPRVQEVTFPKKRIDLTVISPNSSLFWQLPCSWGALYFPEPWIKFMEYLKIRLGTVEPSDYAKHRLQEIKSRFSTAYNFTYPLPPDYDLIVPDSRSNSWKESWKRYMIEYMIINDYVMIYPNFINQTSFSTNWLEPGAHISVNSKVRTQYMDQFFVPLATVETDGSNVLDKVRFLRASNMDLLDLFANPITPEDLAQNKHKLVLRNPNIPPEIQSNTTTINR